MKKSFCVLLTLVTAVLLNHSAHAANFSVSFGSIFQSKWNDLNYDDGESVVFRGVSTMQSIGATLRGINYGDDPGGSDRWGVLDNSLPWNHGVPGGLIRGGFAPSQIGHTTHRLGPGRTTDASQLNFVLEKPENVLFSNLSLEVQSANTLCVEPTAWASTSADGFQRIYPITSGSSGHAERAVWSLSGLEYSGAAPLEIRIYGVVGADEGAIPLIQVLGNATAIPEPGVPLMLALGAVLWSRRRRK